MVPLELPKEKHTNGYIQPHSMSLPSGQTGDFLKQDSLKGVPLLLLLLLFASPMCVTCFYRSCFGRLLFATGRCVLVGQIN